LPSPSQVSQEAKNTGTKRGRGSIVCSTTAVVEASVCGCTCALLTGTSMTSRGRSERAVPCRGALELAEALDAVVVAVRRRLPGTRRQRAPQLEALRRVLEDLDDRPARAGDDEPGFEHGRF
jgi:hypothetical protein